MAMRRALPVLAWLVWAVHGRRVQMTGESQNPTESVQQQMDALATILLAQSGLAAGLRAPSHMGTSRRTIVPAMALDITEPVVEAEFEKVMAMSESDVDLELRTNGIHLPATTSLFDMQSTLVEMRLLIAGKIGEDGKAAAPEEKPTKFASKFDELCWEKPAVKVLHERYQKTYLVNHVNLLMDYCNDPDSAAGKYDIPGSLDWPEVMKDLEEAMNTKIEKTAASGLISFRGFPAGMGEDAVKDTLGSFGEFTDFACEVTDDNLNLNGKVRFATPEAAQALIEQWDQVDMGMGTKLLIDPL